MVYTGNGCSLRRYTTGGTGQYAATRVLDWTVSSQQLCTKLGLSGYNISSKLPALHTCQDLQARLSGTQLAASHPGVASGMICNCQHPLPWLHRHEDGNAACHGSAANCPCYGSLQHLEDCSPLLMSEGCIKMPRHATACWFFTRDCAVQGPATGCRMQTRLAVSDLLFLAGRRRRCVDTCIGWCQSKCWVLCFALSIS